MSKKTGKKSSQASRLQQQQQAAAKRRVVAAAARQTQETPARRLGTVTETSSEPQAVRYYLDVSAVRIQEWLARTPDLRFRRGASALLTEATARDEWEASLPPGTCWNDEAGEVGGVVSLVLAEDVAQAVATQHLTSAARSVARKMRELMPHCYIQAVTGTGESYAAAYPQMEQARRDGRFLVDSPPAAQELILAKPCDQCRSAAATHRRVTIIAREKDPKDLCTDCWTRLEAAGRTSAAKPDRWPLPERRLREALAEVGMIVDGFSGTFAEMASAGQRSEDDAFTQLALIYADGNRVGAFLSEAASLATSGGKLRKTEIATVIDHATVAAFADAVVGRFRDQPYPPVLAHLAGGDDLLVSVPAADAWTFACTLLDAFGKRITEASSGWPEQVREKSPTLSAGIVFHYVKDPFSDVVRLVGDQLKKAKEAGRGLEPTVAFLDLTADGGQAPPERRPVTLAYLTGNAGKLQHIEKLPKSRIATLLALYRQGAADDLIRRLTDLDNQPLWDVILRPGATPDEVRNELNRHPERRDELRRLLDLARHWTTEPAEAGP